MSDIEITSVEDLEKLAGLDRLTGLPVRVGTVKPAAPLVH